ncbi:hypothetical protein PF008_g10995 [Phytophthora fragariae]|uniref:Uncharacterized protein n=1 Tax=Phytophthora fragariae TaxID=53985 RepID=A0A6G0RSM5_9STRA|nr:hypothetical protein PF008_g10995 [Phytophthora fragariae]
MLTSATKPTPIFFLTALRCPASPATLSGIQLNELHHHRNCKKRLIITKFSPGLSLQVGCQ